MSEHSTQSPKPEKLDLADFLIPSTVALAVGVAGIALAVLCTWFRLFGSTGTQLAYSWLFACSYVITISFGSLFWVLLHHATNAGWSVAIRRIVEKAAGMIPYIGLMLLLPMIVLAPKIYLWMTPASLTAAEKHMLHLKEPFLTIPFFWGASVFYFVALSLLALLLKRWSCQQDESGDVKLSLRMRHLAYPGIFFFAVVMTFWAFHWLMGIDFLWFSTMWGVYIFAGSAWSSMALLIVMVTILKAKGYLSIITEEHYHIMGKLLFAFTVFWAYIAFDQYMLYWYANIPEETTFFIKRNQGLWHWYCIFLLTIGHFAVPFLLLLTQWIKRTTTTILAMGCYVLVLHMLDLYWIILPQLHPDTIHLHILDILCLVGVVGVMTFIFLKSLGRHGLFPARDPRLVETLTLKN
ncbi:MAG: hypothetical protein SFY92_02465 [Verrucomicrobiae bacterium]|nr:hypothetical protein [Verrucomicrobiae bacterium]